MNIIEQVNHLNWDKSEIEGDVLTLAYNVRHDTVYESCKAFMATNPSNEQVEQFYVGFVSRFDKRSIVEILEQTCELCNNEVNTIDGDLVAYICQDCKTSPQGVGSCVCENCGRFTNERQMTYTDDNKFICKLCEEGVKL